MSFRANDDQETPYNALLQLEAQRDFSSQARRNDSSCVNPIWLLVPPGCNNGQNFASISDNKVKILMNVLIDPQIDVKLRKEQLVVLNKNLNTLLEREAKYGGNTPLDLLNQIEDHRKAIKLIEQALVGDFTDEELNEALNPLLLALRNGQVVTISLPQVQWLQPLAIFTVMMVIISSIGISFLIFDRGSITDEKQPLPTPISSLFTQLPDWSVTVTALAVYSASEKSTLWIGTETDSKYALYYTDPNQQKEALPEHAIDVKGKIRKLAVDCKGNVWLLIHNVGTRVYHPKTKQYETLLNKETTNNWLTWDTMFAIDSRCHEDGVVEVWLGREGIHTLLYEAEYPTLDTITFLPTEDKADTAFEASHQFDDIRALTYVEERETLWAIDYNGILLEVFLDSFHSPPPRQLDHSPLWSLIHSPKGDSVWIGADSYLIQANDGFEPIPMETQVGKSFGNRAFALALDENWVWFGGQCSLESSTCVPLGVYNYQDTVPVEIGNLKNVNAITVDNNGSVWIGTEKGLLLYSYTKK